MTVTAFYIFGAIFLLAAWTILLGGIKNRKAPSELTVPEFKRNQSRAVAVLCPAIGLLIIGKNIYDWHVSGISSPMFYHAIILGSGAVLYGLYRGWRLSKEN